MSMRVCHFEIHAADPQKAIAFYQRLFGWEFSRWGDEEYWLIRTGPAEARGAEERGIDGGLLRRRGPAPADGQAVNAYVCTIRVPSLDDMLRQVETAGGSIALPKMAVKCVGWLAYAQDDQGNIFGMMQPDPSAE